MTPLGRARLFIPLALAGLLGSAASCSRRGVAAAESPAAPSSVNSPDAGPPACATHRYCSIPLSISPDVPVTLACTLQNQVNIFAWNEFIALNWRASDRGTPDGEQGADTFGEPAPPGQSMAPGVWQTFWSAAELFPSGRSSPRDRSSIPPADCEVPPGVDARTVVASSAFELLDKSTPQDSLQADNEWLADRNGNLVWYELRVNGTERDYIVDGGLYKAARQHALSSPGQPGVNPPPGSIEIKAAWRQLTHPSEYGRYLMINACIPGAAGKKQLAQLGLVGLHILHKTDNQPRWTWATFEHVDNAPDCSGPGECTVDCTRQDCTRYSFYKPGCTPQAVPSACVSPDAGVQQTSCVPNSMPAYALETWLQNGGCPPYPIQVARVSPVPDGDDNCMQRENAWAQARIREANSDSVFQYYQLVSALWWSAPSSDPMQGGVSTPLITDGFQIEPQGSSVANTTLETYVQDRSCIDCHKNAPIANANVDSPCDAGPCAAGYSFFFNKAKQ